MALACGGSVTTIRASGTILGSFYCMVYETGPAERSAAGELTPEIAVMEFVPGSPHGRLFSQMLLTPHCDAEFAFCSD